MNPIVTQLDALLDEHDFRTRAAREPRADRAFRAWQKKGLADASAHPLRRWRLSYRGGISVKELSQRSTVSESLIRAIESGKAENVSDATWARLTLAFGCRREQLDTRFIK